MRRVVIATELAATVILALGGVTAGKASLVASTQTSGNVCRVGGEGFTTYVLVENQESIGFPPGGGRASQTNLFTAESVEIRAVFGGVVGDPDVWTPTDPSFQTDRWDPLVLPTETAAIMYFGTECASGTEGVHEWRLTIHGTQNGEDVLLETSVRYRVVQP